ncbi:MAG: protein TolR [Alphaproteobacteria bacterium]|nr:protein TolR [Alphaproteobacteria bacterium]
MAGSLMPKAQRGAGRSYRRPPMQEINVTPFVDVMLVLLIIFMVTAPLITQGVDISLPEVQSKAISENNEPIQVGIAKNGKVYMQDTEVSLPDIADKITAIKATRPEIAVLLRADTEVDYGQVMKVMSALQGAGIVNIGLETQTP